MLKHKCREIVVQLVNTDDCSLNYFLTEVYILMHHCSCSFSKLNYER